MWYELLDNVVSASASESLSGRGGNFEPRNLGDGTARDG